MDSFQRLIKPQVYNWIHGSIHEVIHMNYKDLQNGTVFPQAVTEFIEWCGEEYYLPSAMRKTANEELWNLQQIKMEFHRVLGDACYTACILQKIEDEYIFPILLWMYIRILKAGVKRYMCPIQPMINMCQGNFTPGKKP